MFQEVLEAYRRSRLAENEYRLYLNALQGTMIR